jgi:hypothetical protein
MLNRVDFFQAEETHLALPAAGVAVLLDGSICPYLQVLEIVREDWPQFSWARLSVNPAAYAESVAYEDVEMSLAAGKSVSILQFYNGSAPDISIADFCIFTGQIEEVHKKFSADGQTLKIIARDFSAILKRFTVYGRQVVGIGGSTIFLDSIDTVFNEDGKPNAINSDNKTVFCAEPSQSKFWSYAEAIRYLLCKYLPDGQLQMPPIELLAELTGNQMVRDLDVTGMDLLEALHRCCEDVGLKFKFVPRPVPTGSAQAIVFFKETSGRTVELNCQPAGERLSASKTDAAAFDSRRNFWPVTHKYIGQGDFKIFEATFDLVKAWDPAGQSSNYYDFSPSTNSDFCQVKDVYRKWCLNEAGDYSGQPYNQSSPFDFSELFGTKNFAAHRRRFWPTLTADTQGKSLGYYLQVSFDNGLHWRQYLHAFNVLLDECGIWLSAEQLDINTWIAAQKDTLKFRITASIISDERISCILADGPVDSTAPVVEHTYTLPRRFKYRKVSGQSIFANSSEGTFGKPDEADDSLPLYEFVRSKAQANAEVIETIDLQTPFLSSDYQIGDIVSVSPESVDLFSCRNDNRSISVIERVGMDFVKQCTELKIVRRRRPQI